MPPLPHPYPQSLAALRSGLVASLPPANASRIISLSTVFQCWQLCNMLLNFFCLHSHFTHIIYMTMYCMCLTEVKIYPNKIHTNNRNLPNLRVTLVQWINIIDNLTIAICGLLIDIVLYHLRVETPKGDVSWSGVVFTWSALVFDYKLAQATPV